MDNANKGQLNQSNLAEEPENTAEQWAFWWLIIVALIMTSAGYLLFVQGDGLTSSTTDAKLAGVKKVMNSTVESRELNPTLANNTQELNSGNWILEVPWLESAERAQHPNYTDRVQWNFSDGKFITIANEPITTKFVDVFRDVNNEDKKDIENIKTLLNTNLNKEVLSSEFSFYETVLNTTEKNAKSSDFQNALLTTKVSILVVYGFDNHGIYKFETDNVRGFQYGTPGVDEEIAFHIFEESGGKAYRMTVANASQSDIDSILSSLRMSQ